METTETNIKFDDFSKVVLRVGTILSCDKVAGSEKLLKLDVDFGLLGKRQILTGMAPYYSCEQLTGLQTVFAYNLEPRKMMGIESQGMLLSVGTDHSQKPMLLKISELVENGVGLS